MSGKKFSIPKTQPRSRDQACYSRMVNAKIKAVLHTSMRAQYGDLLPDKVCFGENI